MKKLLSVAICASAVAAFGTEVPVELGEVGVTAITSSTTNTIVAVSYTDLESGNITASNLVKTANLTLGDYLYVYDGTVFKAFILAGSDPGVKYWQGVTTVSTGAGISAVVNPAASADSTTIPAGQGVWLVRGSNWDGNEFTFYIYGKPATETSVTVTAGTSMLVGNPKTSAASPTVTTAKNFDQIIIPGNTAAGNVIWKYNSSKSLWYYFTSDNVRHSQSSAPEIAAGKGFWYVTGAGASVTITWP